MRIIAGAFRGRRIASPEGRDTRPMLDRVREALFSTLGSRVADARVLDLFSGTGSLGLEALSRGAERVHFVEKDSSALRRLARNIDDLGVGDSTRVHRGDALDVERWTAGDGGEDLVFMDPPYPFFRESGRREEVFVAVRRLIADSLEPGGTLVLHAHPRDVAERDFDDGVDVERRVYGRTALFYLWKPALEEAPE